MIYIDFEFNNTNEEKVNLVCCATFDSKTKEKKNWWLLNNQQQKEALTSYIVDSGQRLYAWAVVAEARSLYSLGLDPTDFDWIDGFLDYKCLSNHNDELNYGKQLVNGKVKFTVKPKPKWERKTEGEKSAGFKPTGSLAEATYKLTGKIRDTEHKNNMRDIIISGDDKLIMKNKKEIMEYCMEDVVFMPDMFNKMVSLFKKYLGKEYNFNELIEEMGLRGSYAALTGIRESKGYPIDYIKTKNFSDQVPSILDDCQRDINAQFPDTPPFKFKKSENRFAWNQTATKEWIRDQGYSKDNWTMTDTWPRDRNKKDIEEHKYYSLSLEAWSKHFDYQHSYPEGNFGAQMVRYLKLKQSLNGFSSNPLKKKKSLWDSVGSDQRVRPYMGIYNSQSSRSQPPSTSYLLLKPAWQRALLTPPPGKCITSIDYGSEEYFISALYSEDENMIESYMSGDVYLAFAILAGMAPEGATRAAYKYERDLCKATVLGISYAMSKFGLAAKLTADTGRIWTPDEAQDLIDKFYDAYPDFKAFQEDFLYDYENMEYHKLPSGWYMWGDNSNFRSVGNMPIQGLGADIMRDADMRAHKSGLYVPCTLHDALYVEHDYGDWEAIDTAVECMREGFASHFPDDYDVARKIKLDPFTWGPDLPKPDISLDDKGNKNKTYGTITTPGGLIVNCSDIYVDERAESEYDKFSKYFETREEMAL